MAHQVADLVDQFVRLDAFLMDFIFEAAMKLASLTDGQLFMMIETSEGRRFAGKDHLCDMYMSGRLKPVGYEMKYHLDSFAPSIVKDYVDPSSSAFRSQNQEDPSSALTTTETTTPSSSTTRPSLKRRNRGGGGGGGGGSAAATASTAAKSPRLSSCASAAAETLNGEASSSALGEVSASAETTTTTTVVTNDDSSSPTRVKRLDFKQEIAEEIYLLDDDDDEDGNGTDNGGGGGCGVDDDFAAIDFNTAVEAMHSQQHIQHQQHRFESSAFDDSHDSVIQQFLEVNPKAQTVSELPPETFLTKDSTSLKLLNSLGYDYCKFMSSHCPTDEDGNFLHRSFFRASFEGFWAQFPNLEKAHLESIANKKTLDFGGVTLKTKIRSKMYSFFLKPIGRKHRKTKSLPAIKY